MARPYHRRVARFTMFLASAAFAALLAPALQAGLPQSTDDGARTVPPATEGAYRWLDPIIDLRALIVGSYVDPIDATAMQRAAMEAMTKLCKQRFEEFGTNGQASKIKTVHSVAAMAKAYAEGKLDPKFGSVA